MKQVVVIVIYSILVLLNQSVESRKCYLCGCEYDWETNYGTCGDADFATNCPLTEVGDKYCFMISTYDGTHETRVFESIAANKLQDSHFIQAVETIALSSTVWLPTTVSSVGYGCDWDGCNNVTLANYLPESFQMKIDQTVLNTELLDGQLPAKACYSCGKCINDLTAILCKQVSCPNGICYIDEIHNYFVTAENNCTYNFFSYCESFTDPVQTPSVRMRATYYIDLPSNKQLEINEVDIRCTKDYCNSIEVVEYLKGQITTTINLHSDFRPSRANTTTTISSTTSQPTISSLSSTTRTTTVTGSPGSTTTQSTTRSTSTNSASELARLYPLSVFYMILMFFLL